MHFTSVTAIAFGAIVDQTLDLAPGLNVIIGPNEAGKSTWHDALYAGLCGMRRGRGAPRAEDREFIERRKPWSAAAWAVGARVELADGRAIELHHDLLGLVDCRAIDVTLGRDVSSEIMHDGAPDGSRWLGLDRRSFIATACVRQSDVLAVMHCGDVLQEHLQRAAATAGRDETAATALGRIDEFKRANVGQDRSNSMRPLRRAIVERQSALASLEAAAAAHREYLHLSVEAEAAAERARGADDGVKQCQAARAKRAAEASAERFRKARDLARRFPDGPPPPRTEDEATARQVARALSAWEDRPSVPELSGPTAEALLRVIGALPPSPVGDGEIHREVATTRDSRVEAGRAARWHAEQRPADPSPCATGGLDEDALRALADALAERGPGESPDSADQLARLRSAVDRARRGTRLRAALLTAGAVLLASGVLLLVVRADLLVVAVSAAAAGAGLLIWSRMRRSGRRYRRALDALSDAESRSNALDRARAEATKRVEGARRATAEHGLPDEPDVLRRMADELHHAEQARDALCRWTDRHEELVRQLEQSRDRMAQALARRGVESSGADVETALERYERDCAERARAGAEAARRPALEQQLQAREVAESSARDAERRRAESSELLRSAAATCRLPVVDDDEEIARSLERWQQERTAALDSFELARNDHATLQALLDGRTLAELEAQVHERRRAAQRLCDDVLEPVQPFPDGVDLDRELERRRVEAREAMQESERVQGRLAERAGTLASVPEAEESLAAAEARLEAVRRLERVLDRTREFLEAAQTRVHRDIAPRLAATLRDWLPRVTGGRYVDASIDPATLQVRTQTSAGESRLDAHRLSHGTAEQVYLLLRLALARHLTKPGEVCPLLLDDVTTHCDAERCERVLELLHEISAEHQVILFSQEDRVARWARARLDRERDALIDLTRDRDGVPA